MSGKKYKDKVEQRTKEEKKAMKAKVAAKKQDLMSELTTDVIRTYFDEDGVGDGKLFNRLHRDKIVGVIDSDDFLFWNGAHWEKAKEKQEFRAIEDVVRLYERLAAEKEKESDSVDKRDDPDLKKELQKQLGAIRRRIKTLRDAPGQDNLKKMTARVDPPLLVYPEQLDDKPRLLPCPNGVINLETGELEQGRPRDYLLTACETEYDPGLLDVEDPCPVANDFLLRSMDGDKELVAFIWRLLGYGLIRERKDHIFMIFHGEHGRNGKDTLIKLITTTLGKALSGRRARRDAAPDSEREELFRPFARCDEAARHVHRVDQRGRGESEICAGQAQETVGRQLHNREEPLLEGGNLLEADAPADHDHERTAKGEGRRCGFLAACAHPEMEPVFRE